MDKNIIEENKRLIEIYPFLKPVNVWTGKEIEDYDYSFTYLDNMPEGWEKAFGRQMCAEIKEALGNDIKNYMIIQVKEKYGQLRWYTNWTTDRLEEIIDKYTKLSEKTCVRCGQPATKISLGWICPWCDECAKNIDDKFQLIED